jgi:hypothetical protein
VPSVENEIAKSVHLDRNVGWNPKAAFIRSRWLGPQQAFLPAGRGPTLVSPRPRRANSPPHAAPARKGDFATTILVALLTAESMPIAKGCHPDAAWVCEA